MTPAPTQQDRAKKLRQLIGIAYSKLGWTDDEIRSVQVTVTGLETKREMSVTQLERLLTYCQKCGFKIRTNRQDGQTAPQPPLSMDVQVRKIRAIWLNLAALGIVKNASESALNAYGKRFTKVERLEWAGVDELSSVIEQLKRWRRRVLSEPARRWQCNACGALYPVVRADHAFGVREMPCTCGCQGFELVNEVSR